MAKIDMNLCGCNKQTFLRILYFFVLMISFGIRAQGFLHVSGSQIVDGGGNSIILKGIGLGGWLLQEGYMLHTPMNSEHEIRQAIIELMGEEKTNEFYEAYHKNYVEKIDIDNLAQWGFNSIRLPMHYNKLTPLDQPGVYIEEGFQVIDQLLDWCEANQIYLILDLHAAPGGQNSGGISDYDPSKPSLWESEANKQKTVDLWRQLADRYKNETWIGGYDILNEPAWNLAPNNQPLRDLYIRITNAIREVDNNHIIFIEGNWYATDFTGLTPAWDANMVYSFHKYWNLNEKKEIQNYLNLRSTTGLPLWCGEFGENSNSWIYDCIKLFQENNIGWAIWPHKKIDNISGPLSSPLTPQFQQVLNYWNGSGAKPSQSSAYAALMLQADKLKFGECRIQYDYIDALFRQQVQETTIPFVQNEIPGRIFAVNFDLGRINYAYFDTNNGDIDGLGGEGWNSGGKYRNEGVDIESCSDSYTNGYNVGWINSGDWLKYTVNVLSSQNYELNLRLSANNSGGKILVMIDEANLTDFIDVPVTGGWQSWRTVTIPDLYIEEGIHTITVRFFFGGFNLNYIEFMPGTSGADNQGDSFISYSLAQNYPNPFNPETFINYSIGSDLYAGDQWVKLKIFDALGREVAVLVDEEQKPGKYSVKFDSKALASGLYFYRLSTSQFSDVRKMIILK